jgi:COMPASS component SPP1
MNTAASDSESNDGGEYCICRGPDDHRMMVYCDGGCEDWYHCSCVGIDEDDAKELLDRFICPKCHKEGELFTTWKRMCRCNNVPTILCRKAAGVTLDPPSKYCSTEHAVLFWKFIASQVRTDDAPSIGGALNFKEVGQLLAEAPTAEEFHKLGQKPRLPVKEGADPSMISTLCYFYIANIFAGRPVGLDYLNEDEEKQIAEIREKKKRLEDRIKGYQNQQKLLIMVNDRVKIAAKEPNLEVKDICGFDNRLAMNEEEFDEWFNSEEGKQAFATGKLAPRTAETKGIGARVPYPGQVVPAPPKVSAALDNLCLKPKRKCQHLGWLNIHGTDFVNMQQILKQEMLKLVKAEEEIIEDAELREATKSYYAENETIQLF